MAIPKRNIRGLQDIHTFSGSADQKFLPHKAYMKISCLEMEKFRRGKERESAAHRVKNIDARFREIEAEKDVLLRSLGERDGGAPDARAPGRKPAPRRDGRGVRVKY